MVEEGHNVECLFFSFIQSRHVYHEMDNLYQNQFIILFHL